MKKHIILGGKCLNCKKEMNYLGCTKEKCEKFVTAGKEMFNNKDNPNPKTMKEGIVETGTKTLNKTHKKEEQNPNKEYYFLSQDNDTHWFVIPLSKEKEWDEWCNIPTDDERSWEAPKYAREIGGSPSLVKFGSYHIE